MTSSRPILSAATVRNILDFPKEFSPPAEVITQDRNYRSTQPILTAANGLIGLAKEPFTENLWTHRPSNERPCLVTVRDEGDPAKYVAEEVLENRETGIGNLTPADVYLGRGDIIMLVRERNNAKPSDTAVCLPEKQPPNMKTLMCQNLR